MKKGKSVGDSASQEKLTDSVDLESCPVVLHPGRKRKTTQNTQSHGSFFLRVGAIGMTLKLYVLKLLENLLCILIRFYKTVLINELAFIQTTNRNLVLKSILSIHIAIQISVHLS